jgi:hypothetical protein
VSHRVMGSLLSFEVFSVALLLGCAPSSGGSNPNAAPLPPALASGDSPPEGPMKHRAEPTTARITAKDLMTRLYVFADDSMLGREAGTEGNLKATAYLADEARRLGLEPRGENGTFFQDVPIVSTALDPSSSLQVSGARLELGRDFLPLPVLPSPLFPFGARPLVDSVPSIYVGRVGDTISPGLVEQTVGKLVVLGAPRTAEGSPDWRFFVYRQPPPFRRAAAIAIATLDITPPKAIDILRTDQPLLASTLEARRGTPSGMLLSGSAAARLFGASVDSLKAGAPGKTVQARVLFTNTPAGRARNVVAVLTGIDSILRSEYVAIGAHSDHLGTQSPAVDHDSVRAFNAIFRPEGENSAPAPATGDRLVAARATLDSLRRLRPARLDSTFNGADDDGSGSVTLLEIAEALRYGPVRPKRSVLFVWHTAEEKGLYGSEWFTDHPTVPRSSIVAQLNMDMVGRGRASDVAGGGPNVLGLVGSRRLSTELGDIIEAINRSPKHGFALDYRYDANGHPDKVYCRSDHYMYARFGIPIAFFSTGLHRDYHEVTDEPQYIDYTHMARVAELVKDVALAVTNLNHRPAVDRPVPDRRAPCEQ